MFPLRISILIAGACSRRCRVAARQALLGERAAGGGRGCCGCSCCRSRRRTGCTADQAAARWERREFGARGWILAMPRIHLPQVISLLFPHLWKGVISLVVFVQRHNHHLILVAFVLVVPMWTITQTVIVRTILSYSHRVTCHSESFLVQL